MYGCYCLWVAFFTWTTTQLSLIASVASEKMRPLCCLCSIESHIGRGDFVNLRWKMCGMQNLDALLKLTTTPTTEKRSAASWAPS